MSSTIPFPPREQLCKRSCSNKLQHPGISAFLPFGDAARNLERVCCLLVLNQQHLHRSGYASRSRVVLEALSYQELENSVGVLSLNFQAPPVGHAANPATAFFTSLSNAFFSSPGSSSRPLTTVTVLPARPIIIYNLYIILCVVVV